MIHTLRLRVVLPGAACGMLALAAPLAAPLAAQDAERADALASRALELVNAARAEAGLGALTADAVLDEAARTHADDMLARDFYAHVAPDGTTARDRFEAAGGAHWAVSGENIARCSGCDTPPGEARVEAFHAGWMQSPPHRENILSPGFARFGYGIAGEGGETYAVQTFAGPGADEGEEASSGELRAAALEAVDAARAERGLDALAASPALDAAAEAALEAVLAEGALPGDLFALLPEDAEGWTSLSVRSASRGGAGRRITRADAEAFADGWAEAADAPFGGPGATHMGFAAQADGRGRKTAAAVFGAEG